MKQKYLALSLSLLLVFSLVPTAAFAAGTDGEIAAITAETDEAVTIDEDEDASAEQEATLTMEEDTVAAEEADEETASEEPPDSAEETEPEEAAEQDEPTNAAADVEEEPESDLDERTAETDGVTVTVSAEKGVLPDAELVVQILAEDDGRYGDAEEALADENVIYDSLLVLDVGFRDENGDEAEPNGEVSVSLQIPADLVKDFNEDALAVYHLAETDGAAEVEYVADTEEEASGTVALSDDTVTAEFEVESFSLIVLASSDNTSSDKTLTVGSGQTYTTVQQAINAIYEESDPTGWTIEIESGTYLQFAVPKELEGLTVKTADGATVTITTWTGGYDSALTATYNSATSSNSYYNTQGYQYVFNAVYVQAENVTLSGLTFTLGDYVPTEGQYWYRACITDIGGYANGKTMSTGLTVTNSTFSSDKQGYVTTYPTGSTYDAYGILIGASTSWTVTGCTFTKFSSAICFMCDGHCVSSKGITVTNNTFTSCDRAMDGYYGGTPSGTAGTLSFADNTVTGTSALRSKVVVMDQVSGGSIGAVSVTGNTFAYAMVLMENMAESSCTVNDILSDNTFENGSYYVEGDGWYYGDSYNGNITVTLPDAAYYESSSTDTGYWVLNIDLDGLSNNSAGATAYVQALIDEANASGSHTLSITWLDTTETDLLWTVTAFKDCIYWVSVDTVDVEVTKVWDDNSDQDGLRPDQVTVELYRNDKATGKTLVLSADNNWGGTSRTLPRSPTWRR